MRIFLINFGPRRSEKRRIKKQNLHFVLHRIQFYFPVSRQTIHQWHKKKDFSASKESNRWHFLVFYFFVLFFVSFYVFVFLFFSFSVQCRQWDLFAETRLFDRKFIWQFDFQYSSKIIFTLVSAASSVAVAAVHFSNFSNCQTSLKHNSIESNLDMKLRIGKIGISKMIFILLFREFFIYIFSSLYRRLHVFDSLSRVFWMHLKFKFNSTFFSRFLFLPEDNLCKYANR